jgi:hypothetical protein
MASLVLMSGGTHSTHATFTSQASRACAAFVRSRPSQRIAPTYQLQGSGTKEELRQRSKLVNAIAQLAPPPGKAALVNQFLAALRATNTVEYAALQSLERTHSPIISHAIGAAWKRQIREAQRAARALNIPPCVSAAAA